MLVSQIVGVESPTMVLDPAQARTMGKLMRDPSYMDDLLKDNSNRRCREEGRTWDDFDNLHLMDDKYTSILGAIIGKAGRVSKEGNERISWGGNCSKTKVPKINLNCSTTAPKSKWEKCIKRTKQGNWILYSDGSKHTEARVGSVWVLHSGKIQGQQGMGKLAKVWNGEIKGIAEALAI